MIKCGRPSKGEEQLSRDRILDASKLLFLEHGYGNLNMETIAKDAHVSLRTIYNLFDGKPGLFGALIRRCSDQWLLSLSLEDALENSLICFGNKFLFQTTRADAIRLRAILIGESPRFPDLALQFYEQGPKRTQDFLADFFKHHQQENRIIKTDPHFLADQFLSSLRGERFQRLQLSLEAPPDQDEIEKWVQQVIKQFLYGCFLGEQR
jgi:AcrR family transcriptional regulator